MEHQFFQKFNSNRKIYNQADRSVVVMTHLVIRRSIYTQKTQTNSKYHKKKHSKSKSPAFKR